VDLTSFKREHDYVTVATDSRSNFVLYVTEMRDLLARVVKRQNV